LCFFPFLKDPSVLGKPNHTTQRRGISNTLKKWYFRQNLPIFIASLVSNRHLAIRKGDPHRGYYRPQTEVKERGILNVLLIVIIINRIVHAAVRSSLTCVLFALWRSLPLWYRLSNN